jgi:DNA-binding response OmpR family regulator
MAATILIVEDEHAVARGIQYALQQEGYNVGVARSGEEGLEIATREAPDLVVLDVRLPGIDGFEVLRRVRAAGAKMPILVLTARDDEVDKVIGLELGADDYLTKPFGLRELLSRIKALLRRSYGELADAAGGRVIRHQDLVIDLERRRVQRGARRISLTPTEFEILRHLATRPGRVYTRGELLELLRENWESENACLRTRRSCPPKSSSFCSLGLEGALSMRRLETEGTRGRFSSARGRTEKCWRSIRTNRRWLWDARRFRRSDRE